MLSYPINDNVREALKRFPNIARLVMDKMPGSGRSKLEIVRLLGNTHCPNIEQTLHTSERTASIVGQYW